MPFPSLISSAGFRLRVQPNSLIPKGLHSRLSIVWPCTISQTLRPFSPPSHLATTASFLTQFLPQGLCTCYFLRLGYSSPDLCTVGSFLIITSQLTHLHRIIQSEVVSPHSMAFLLYFFHSPPLSEMFLFLCLFLY